MTAPFIDWSKATVKVTVPVHHTATSDTQEIEVPLTFVRSCGHLFVLAKLCDECRRSLPGDAAMRNYATCVCGHSQDWHSHAGTGDCEHNVDCRCAEFTRTDGEERAAPHPVNDPCSGPRRQNVAAADGGVACTVDGFRCPTAADCADRGCQA